MYSLQKVRYEGKIELEQVSLVTVVLTESYCKKRFYIKFDLLMSYVIYSLDAICTFLVVSLVKCRFVNRMLNKNYYIHVYTG